MNTRSPKGFLLDLEPVVRAELSEPVPEPLSHGLLTDHRPGRGGAEVVVDNERHFFRPVSLIHLDAHADTAPINPEFLGGGAITDGNLFTWAVVEGLVDPERTIQIGLRGGGVGMTRRMSEDFGMRTVTMEEFEQIGVEAVVEEARRVVGEGACYLSFDTDALGSPYMQGTNLAEPFGITDREARTFLRGLRGLDLVGADLVETTPANDVTGASSNLAAGLAFEMLCLLAEARCERIGERRPTNWA